MLPITRKHFDITVNCETANAMRIMLNGMNVKFEELTLFGATTFFVYTVSKRKRCRIQNAVSKMFEEIGSGSMKMDAFPHK